jgi:hypothetical protein
MQSQQPSSRTRPSPDIGRQHYAKDEIGKGSGGLACLIFVGLLVCAFWVGAMFATHPMLH